MLKIKYVLLVVMVIAFSLAGCSKKEYMRFDGFYSNQQSYYDVTTYLKFYPDGTVTASLPPTVNNVIQFRPEQLDKNRKECTIKGRYALKNNKVVFKLIDPNGSADFSGEFKENKLVLKVHSNINGKDSENVYDFYKL